MPKAAAAPKQSRPKPSWWVVVRWVDAASVCDAADLPKLRSFEVGAIPDDDAATLLAHVARRTGVPQAALRLATAGGAAIEAGRPLRWYGLRCGDVLALQARAGGGSSFARQPLEPRKHESARNAAWGQPVPRKAPHFRQPRNTPAGQQNATY